MMKPAIELKRKLDNNALITGVLVTFHVWSGFIEIARKSGLDYVIIDQEHGAHNDETVAEVCAVGRRIDFAVFIRPIDSGYSTIRRTIDRGPCGILLPSVDDPAQLDRVADATRLPPRGHRRPGGVGNFWVDQVDYDSWRNDERSEGD